MFSTHLQNVRDSAPLIHNITNYVTANDCANILLASGASPIMSDALEEVAEITASSTGLNINIGTLNKQTVEAMFLAGKEANRLCKPVLLDPVGAGASAFRRETAQTLLNKIQFTVIRGNISELKTLLFGSHSHCGVDADIADSITDTTLLNIIPIIQKFAREKSVTIVITGAIDIVADKNRTFVIRNGHPLMSQITGTGCMLSALITAFVSANPTDTTQATAAAVITMGLSGELAAKRMENLDGNASYRRYLVDALYNLDTITLDKGAKYEIL